MLIIHLRQYLRNNILLHQKLINMETQGCESLTYLEDFLQAIESLPYGILFIVVKIIIHFHIFSLF